MLEDRFKDDEDYSGTPWIPDQGERDALREDLNRALEADFANLMAELKPKRVVHYNPEAVLCPACQKRIRLNNNGRLRVHISGKAGSGYCMGSNFEPFTEPMVVAEATNKPVSDNPLSPQFFQKGDRVWDQPPLFSDLD